VLAGEARALARLITGLENGEVAAALAMRELAGRPRKAQIIGITGPPGSGKSTLTDKLIAILRARGRRVGVLAVDPSSPFTGGAILGDRLRMQDHATDPGVFIRSLAARGHLGGISRATLSTARALDAAGYEFVIIETVGVGQSEVDVVRVADTVVLVAVPGLGDDIQVIKAGVMEIGDVFVVNKADRDGADRVVREIRGMLETAATLRRGAAPARASVDTLAGRRAGGDWPASGGLRGPTDSGFDLAHHLALGPGGIEELSGLPPVLKTVAETGEGVEALLDAIVAHREAAEASGELDARRLEGARAELRSLVEERLDEALKAGEGAALSLALAKSVATGGMDAYSAASELIAILIKGGIA
jgi:LAO/AO transport system kinase